MSAKRNAYVGKACVACGNCVKYCLFGATNVHKGFYAKVDEAKCKDYGKCVSACPAEYLSGSQQPTA